MKEMYEDVLIEILMRLPVKSLMRFKCVSKLWLSLISSRHLTNLFLKTSPRSRFYAYTVDEVKLSEYSLLASSHSDTSLTVRIDQDLTIPTIRGGYFVSSVRGLVCFKNGRRVQICNVNTRHVVELPLVDENAWIYFGYESINDEYKVLSIVWEISEDKERVVRSENHVLILGSQASWKKTQNHIPHRPNSEGIIINNVLFYEAWTNGRCVLMSFDLSSEEFKHIELPIKKVHNFGSLSCINLMNYKGKVAVCSYLTVVSTNGTVKVWVLEEDYKSQWSEKTFVLPVSKMKCFQGDELTMGGGSGTSRSGHIWLRKINLRMNRTICFFIYDLERNEIVRRIVTRSLLGSFKEPNFLVSTFWDDIASIMFLET